MWSEKARERKTDTKRELSKQQAPRILNSNSQILNDIANCVRREWFTIHHVKYCTDCTHYTIDFHKPPRIKKGNFASFCDVHICACAHYMLRSLASANFREKNECLYASIFPNYYWLFPITLVSRIGRYNLALNLLVS